MLGLIQIIALSAYRERIVLELSRMVEWLGNEVSLCGPQPDL